MVVHASTGGLPILPMTDFAVKIESSVSNTVGVHAPTGLLQIEEFVEQVIPLVEEAVAVRKVPEKDTMRSACGLSVSRTHEEWRVVCIEPGGASQGRAIGRIPRSWWDRTSFCPKSKS